MTELTAPWYAPYAAALAELGPLAREGRWADCLIALNRRAAQADLHNAAGLPVRFTAEAPPAGMAYEARIHRDGLVHTRAGEGGWHDLFNALVWLVWPRTKASLNALQAAEIARHGVGGRRGGLRDAATLVDENGVLVTMPPGPWREAWSRHDWPALFVSGRAQWLAAPPLILGHALLDKLRAPYKAVCGHAWLLEAGAISAEAIDAPGDPSGPDAPAVPPENPRAVPSLDAPLAPGRLAALDVRLAAALSAGALASGRLRPLPVLGVPGWWPANQAPGFYDDATVFRPAPQRNSITPSSSRPKRSASRSSV
ncbi:MAG: DUF3025 domain-containing protein [Betaproteobacteria bacterium]|nr:DUF3025 domain-containing protein [Betaproteobacteria bacterium]